jgi:nitrite reductase/ring-hydroxylating ferredoxin subunit
VSAWHEVGSLAQLERDGRLLVRIGGREIGVLVGPDGSLVAIRNRCPHHGAPLCRGRVVERLTGAPGSWELAARAALRCPWHGWEFDLGSGRCLDEPSLRVAVYPVRVEAGHVLVEA